MSTLDRVIKEIEHAERRFLVCEMSHETPTILCEQFVRNETVAPFSGFHLNDQIWDLDERLEHPHRAIYYLVEPAKPEILLGTLQTVKTTGTPWSLDQILAGYDLSKGVPDTVTAFSVDGFVKSKNRLKGAADFLLDAAIEFVCTNGEEGIVTLSPVFKLRKKIGTPEYLNVPGLRIPPTEFDALLKHAVTNEVFWQSFSRDPAATHDLIQYCAWHLLRLDYDQGNNRYYSECQAGNTHLRRGTSLEQLNFGSSSTEIGNRESLTMTCNWRYSRNAEDIRENKKSFAEGFAARSMAVHNLIMRNVPERFARVVY